MDRDREYTLEMIELVEDAIEALNESGEQISIPLLSDSEYGYTISHLKPILRDLQKSL